MIKKILYSLGGILLLLIIISYENPSPKVVDYPKNLSEDTKNIDPEEVVTTRNIEENNTQSYSQTENNNLEKIDKKSDLYLVTRVIDGDTLEIKIDGLPETVRLIGIDTPETVDPRKPAECFGVESSTYSKNILQGKMVQIEYDETQGKKDKYGRLLLYLYTEDGLFFNKSIIEEGYAHEYTYNTPYKYQNQFKEAEKNAVKNKKGLWNENTCNGNKEIKNQSTTIEQKNSTGFYTSSHYSAKYYYPESCDDWKSLSPNYLKHFDSLEELLNKYERTISPQCN